MRTILVTWWAGFIGSHTVVALQQAGYEVVSIDNFANSTPQVNEHIASITWKEVIFYEWNIDDTELLDSIFAKHKIEGVIHFAAFKSVGDSCRDPFAYYENNLVWSLRLFEAMRAHGIKNIIFSSSATVYDVQKLMPPFGEEDLIWNSASPYGTTKIIGEYILRDIAMHSWFHVLALRYFNPVGAHPSWLIGENPKDTPTNLLPIILRVAAGQSPKLNVYGNDYATTDGSCIRDYIHVDDVAQGHVAALAYMLEHPEVSFDAVNLGTGRWTSVLECIAIAEKVTEKKITFEIVARRPWDVPISVAAVEKAKKLFAWEAKLSIEDAVRDAWHFRQSQS